MAESMRNFSTIKSQLRKCGRFRMSRSHYFEKSLYYAFQPFSDYIHIITNIPILELCVAAGKGFLGVFHKVLTLPMSLDVSYGVFGKYEK